MNIYDYVDNYGIYTFDEKPITLVDKVIFSFLSYVNFQGIVKYNKITIKEAGRIHLGMHKLNEVNKAKQTDDVLAQVINTLEKMPEKEEEYMEPPMVIRWLNYWVLR